MTLANGKKQNQWISGNFESVFETNIPVNAVNIMTAEKWLDYIVKRKMMLSAGIHERVALSALTVTADFVTGFYIFNYISEIEPDTEYEIEFSPKELQGEI